MFVQKKALNITQVEIKDLRPAPYNPRYWSEKATEDLKKSLQKYGFVDPVILNKTPSRFNRIIGGHFRSHCWELLGHKTVPAVYIDIEDEETEQELSLRLNANTGTWDLELLRDFDPNFLIDIGFSDDEISHLFDDYLEIESESENKNNEKEVIEVKVKQGDIYQLGKHRLICGDSHDPTTLTTLFTHKQEKNHPLADIIINDPIYNLGLEYDKGIASKANYQSSRKINDYKSIEDYTKFLDTGLKYSLRFTKHNAHCFYFIDQNYIGVVQQLYKENNLKHQRVLSWIKNNFNLISQVAFNKATESVVYGIRGKPYLNPDQTKLIEVINKNVNHGNRSLEDIIDLFDIWLCKRVSGKEYSHSCQKPTDLYEKPLKRCSKAGDLILDIYAGSGSCLIACESLKRICYTAEIDETYCQKIINRFEEFTNKKAVLLNPENHA